MDISPLKLKDLYEAWLAQEEEDEEEDELFQKVKKYGHHCYINDYGEYVFDEDATMMLRQGEFDTIADKEENVARIFGSVLNEYSTTECMPPSKTWVVCLLEDKKSGKKKILSSFFSGEKFLESPKEDAESIEKRATHDAEKELWEVKKWFHSNL